MDYTQAIDWLYKQLPMFSRVGAAAYKPGLGTSIALDTFFGHPHKAFRSIHVAGTNGKGSVSHTLAAILQSQGYKVGLYTSPHLVDFRERIRVNGEMIPRDAVAEFVTRYRNSGYDGHPSFFELTMMMGFDWFRTSKVDIAVIEVGMGGRLDSTNIITPIGCVITNISKDHTQFLGNTLEAIASEKAGIIKAGIPVTIGEADGRVREVFEQKISETHSPAYFASDSDILQDTSDLTDITDCQGRHYSFELHGDYQRANIRTIFCSVAMLRKHGLDISDEALANGLAHVCSLTGLVGRWSQLCDHPLIIADTGHNEAGIKYNMVQLAKLQKDKGKLHMVIGFVADKDVAHILPLLPSDALYYVTQASIPRAMPSERLAEMCAENGLAFSVYPTVSQAYTEARQRANENDIIYIGGSTFVVADLLAFLNSHERDK